MINNKIYIGKHKTLDLEDNYLGSGRLLRLSIQKYGIKNFKKDILYVFDNEIDMNMKEKELVTEDFCSQENNYNLCPGGNGGFGFINKKGLNVGIDKQRKLDPSLQQRAATNSGIRKKWLMENDLEHRKICLDKIKKGLSEYYKNNDGHFTGKKHSAGTKEKMSLAKRGKVSGNKNSQYGTMWVTNGSLNKKIKKDLDIIPEGWYKGRTYLI